jgi:hypothetical protein
LLSLLTFSIIAIFIGVPSLIISYLFIYIIMQLVILCLGVCMWYSINRGIKNGC